MRDKIRQSLQEQRVLLFCVKSNCHLDVLQVLTQVLTQNQWADMPKQATGKQCIIIKLTGAVEADRYSEGASSNPTRVNIFQLTSAVSDYHEKFLFMYISEDDSETVQTS